VRHSESWMTSSEAKRLNAQLKSLAICVKGHEPKVARALLEALRPLSGHAHPRFNAQTTPHAPKKGLRLACGCINPAVCAKLLMRPHLTRLALTVLEALAPSRARCLGL